MTTALSSQPHATPTYPTWISWRPYETRKPSHARKLRATPRSADPYSSIGSYTIRASLSPFTGYLRVLTIASDPPSASTTKKVTSQEQRPVELSAVVKDALNVMVVFVAVEKPDDGW
ncbi:hypothetical protein B296_00028110 [Ensete ventricosum]|uniref:Uncharacterized protein n=1 Tax=Ensete ventricosum TaxID=4639 RepID=A0A426Y1J3_ENSVE|nr:hypothetical protein B296_00028110 [Ensete ventricosum]